MEPSTHRYGGLPVLVWRFDEARLVVSSAPVGGGLGPRRWALNAQVDLGYAGTDLEGDVARRAQAAGVGGGEGVGMLTAADVTDVQHRAEDGVRVWSTVGIAVPTWAAAPDGAWSPAPGTINVVASLPVRLSAAALVNAVATVAEAKAQALAELGVEGTGTATDTVCIACPLDTDSVEPYGGPRSTWGARLARAVHATVLAGAPRSIARFS